MKRYLTHLTTLSSLLVLGLSIPTIAMEETRDIIIRNGLGRAIHFEVNGNHPDQEADKFNVQARWEIKLKQVKVDLSDPLAFRVRLDKAADDASETVSCSTIFTTFSLTPNIAVIISDVGGSVRCDTIDLNGSPIDAKTSFQQSVLISRLALRN